MRDPAQINMADIKAELQRDIVGVLGKLGIDLPPRSRKGSYYLMSSPLPGRVDKTPSFAIYHSGTKAGQFIDFGGGKEGELKGDIFDLAVAMGAARDPRDARAWGMNLLGWDDLGARGLSPEELAHKREVAKQERIRRERLEAKALARDRGKAFKDWRDLSPGLVGTLAEDYFIAARGIPLSALPRVPGCLRFHPGLNYTDRPKMGGGYEAYPALVALISGPDGTAWATHRTYLERHGRRKLMTTGDEKARKIWPSFAGGMIRLAKGASKLSPEKANEAVLSGDQRHCRPVILTEGIEDGIVNMFAAPEHRIWAAVSLSNLMNVPDMACISEFIVWQDNDWDKPQAIAAFESAIARLQGFGKPVRVVAPKHHQDANDILLAHRKVT